MDPVERLRRGHAVAMLIRLGWKPPPLNDFQAHRLLDDMRRIHPSATLDLSASELRVLQHAADGFTRERISTELQIPFETVKDNFKHIRRKLAANSTTHAVAIAIREGLIE